MTIHTKRKMLIDMHSFDKTERNRSEDGTHILRKRAVKII